MLKTVQFVLKPKTPRYISPQLRTHIGGEIANLVPTYCGLVTDLLRRSYTGKLVGRILTLIGYNAITRSPVNCEKIE